MLGQRCSGLGCSPRRRAATTRRGVRPRGMGTMRPRALPRASSSDPIPANGRMPNSASQSATQKANWSVRGLSASPKCCSGAMYAGVPSTSPSSWDDAVGSQASPKSTTLTRPLRSTIALVGLKSRWSTPSS